MNTPRRTVSDPPTSHHAFAMRCVAVALAAIVSACGAVSEHHDGSTDSSRDVASRPDAIVSDTAADGVVPADVTTIEASAVDVIEEDSCIGSCMGHQCGDDGCGNSCGTCGADEACGTDHLCHSTLAPCGCWAGACVNCYCGQANADYAAAHHCSIEGLRGHEGDLWSCTGGTWSVGTTCSNGCYVAPVGTPDGCRSAGGRQLWIAFESTTAACQTNTVDFYNCLFAHTNFNDYVEGWGQSGISGVGGFARVACGNTDWQCIVNQAHFHPAPYDVILHLWGSSCGVGHNHWRESVVVDGVTIPIRGAEAPTGSVCSCQTALGMHEVYEAAAQDSAADCCNGQTWSPLHGNCSTTIRSMGGAGWYNGTCNGTTYRFHEISPASNWTDISGCSRLTTF